MMLDIPLGDNPAKPSISLFPGGRDSTDLLQREEHLSVSQRLLVAAAGTAHGLVVIVCTCQ